MDERYLKTRIAKGDKTAFAIVFREYYGKVFRFIVSMVKDKYSAEDIAQDVFMRLWKRRSHLESIKSLDDYLFIISRNSVVDHFRKAAKRKQLSIEEMDSILMSRISLDPDRALDARSEMENVLQAMLNLPAKRRDIYMMSRIDGMSNDEIAAFMGISRKTVENQIYLAGDYLRKNFS